MANKKKADDISDRPRSSNSIGSLENSEQTEPITTDFEQQYEQYRNLENSRLRYVEFYVTLVSAVLALYGVLTQSKGFPIQTLEVMASFAILFAFLFEVGRRLIGSFTSTRVAQLCTALYIQKLREHLMKKQNLLVLAFSDVAIGRNWWDPLSHAIRLILLVVFVNSIVLAMTAFQSSHFLLRLAIPEFAENQVAGLSYDMIISSAIAAASLVTSYFLLKRNVKKELESAQKRKVEEIEGINKRVLKAATSAHAN